jgi:hypothetical protein
MTSIPFDNLGKARNRLLERLAKSGHILVTPLLRDEFSQMNVRDCRDFVERVEDRLRSLIARAS